MIELCIQIKFSADLITMTQLQRDVRRQYIAITCVAVVFVGFAVWDSVNTALVL